MILCDNIIEWYKVLAGRHMHWGQALWQTLNPFKFAPSQSKIVPVLSQLAGQQRRL